MATLPSWEEIGKGQKKIYIKGSQWSAFQANAQAPGTDAYKAVQAFGSPEAIVKAIVESDIQYDQVILEFNRWVHLSFAKENPRLQALIIDKKGVRVYSNN